MCVCARAYEPFSAEIVVDGVLGPAFGPGPLGCNVGFDVDLSGISGDKPGPPQRLLDNLHILRSRPLSLAYSPPNSFPAGFSLLILHLNDTYYPNP